MGGAESADTTLGGDFERDTVVFTTTLKVASITAPDHNSSKITIKTADGTDTLTNVEFGKFGAKLAPLFNWHFDITRSTTKDGVCTIRFSENGKELFRSAGAYCDDATPINSGIYDAYFRTDATTNKQVVELLDTSSGTTPRSVVQIHGGDSTQNSEGCFVLPRAQLRSFMNHIEARMGDVIKGALNGHKGYDIPIPITVSLDGPVSQPELSLGVGVRVAEGKTASIGLSWNGDGATPGITKVVCVTLKVTQSDGCSYGKGNDWHFSGSAWNKSLASISLDRLYDPGRGIIEFYMPAGTDTAKLGIAALSDRANERSEKVSLKLVDLDVFNLKNGALRKYSDSVPNSASPVDHLLAEIGDTATFTIDNVAPAAAKGVIPFEYEFLA